MCQFGDSSKIILEQIIEQSEALIGYRLNYIINPFNDKEKFLKSLKQYFIWNKNEIIKGNPTKENSEGIYSYNNNYYKYNYYNYNNYNNNYYNYDNNYYNNYNNNYKYNYYNYNNYNNNYYYNICLNIKHWGKIFSYEEGFRSEFAIPYQLVILDKNSKWFTDKNTIKFANHFNLTVEQLAKEYNCEVIEFSEFIK